MGHKYKQESSQECVTILHSSTHPLLDLSDKSKEITRERLDTLTIKAKEYRKMIRARSVYTTPDMKDSISEAQRNLGDLRRMAKRDESLKKTFEALLEIHRELKNALEETMIEQYQIGPDTAKIHKDISRKLGTSSTYSEGTAFTRACTLAVYHAREEDSPVNYIISETDNEKVRRLLKEQDLEKKISVTISN